VEKTENAGADRHPKSFFHEGRELRPKQASTAQSCLAGCGKTTVRPEMLLRFHDLCG
jgi:hypothetical protein